MQARLDRESEAAQRVKADLETTQQRLTAEKKQLAEKYEVLKSKHTVASDELATQKAEATKERALLEQQVQF